MEFYKCSIKTTKRRKKEKTKLGKKDRRPQRVKHVVDINLTITIITLNVNDLNVSIKRQKF